MSWIPGNKTRTAAGLSALLIQACAAPDWTEAQQVIERNCGHCHSDPPQEFVPVPLATYAQTQVESPSNPGFQIFEVIEFRIQDEQLPMPPKGMEMPAADRQVLLDWIEAGAQP